MSGNLCFKVFVANVRANSFSEFKVFPSMMWQNGTNNYHNQLWEAYVNACAHGKLVISNRDDLEALMKTICGTLVSPFLWVLLALLSLLGGMFRVLSSLPRVGV